MKVDYYDSLRLIKLAPLDSKIRCRNTTTLANLGAGDNLAYTYYNKLIVYCVEEDEYYMWRERVGGDAIDDGLVASDFTYPNNVVYDGEDYSNKSFNFFRYLQAHELPPYTMQSVGTGIPIYFSTEENTFNISTITSNTFLISVALDGTITIDSPPTADIPALYVNNLYIPTYEDFLDGNTKGLGTLLKPFTDTVNYTTPTTFTTTPGTSIQNALDAYVGTGLGADGINPASRLNPKRSGQWIIVQNNNSFYYHYGDYNYSNLKIRFQGSVVNTTSNYIVDMDNPSYFNSQSSGFTISIDEGIIFQCTDSLGFRNSGNTSSLPPSYDTSRIGFIEGEGALYFSYNGSDILNRYIFTGEGNNNDDNLHFQVRCIVKADQQGIYLTKNKMRIDFYNLLQSGTLLGSGNVNLQAFRMTGGQVRFYQKGSVSLQNGITGRIYGFTFEPEDDGIGYCNFQLNSAQVAGNSLNCFAKLNNEHVEFLAFNSPSGNDFATTLLGVNTVVNGLFENLGEDKWSINFKNNVFSYTGIDTTKVDLTLGNTVSSSNVIGNNIIESLIVHTSKQIAQNAGLVTGSKFLKRTSINAGSFTVGQEYKITTVGTTDFTSIGADSNSVGEWFIATGIGSGTGVAVTESIEII